MKQDRKEIFDVEDDCQAQIDLFADLVGGSVRQARHGREQAIRAVCVAHPNVEPALVKGTFDRQLARTLGDKGLGQQVKSWLKNLAN